MSSSGKDVKGRRTTPATVPGAVTVPATEEPEAAVVPRASIANEAVSVGAEEPEPLVGTTAAVSSQAPPYGRGGRGGKARRTTAPATTPGAVVVAAEEPELLRSTSATAQAPSSRKARRTTAPATTPGAVVVAAEEPELLRSTSATVQAPIGRKGRRTTAPATTPGAVLAAAEEPETVQLIHPARSGKGRRTSAPATTPGVMAVALEETPTTIQPVRTNSSRNISSDTPQTVSSGKGRRTTAPATTPGAVVNSSLDDTEYRRRLENKVKESEYEYMGVTEVDNTSAFDDRRNPADPDKGVPDVLHDEKRPFDAAPNMVHFQPDLEPTAGAINPADRASAPLVTIASRGVAIAPDLEYGTTGYGGAGLSGNPGDESLAVAIAVTEEDEELFLPAAVEYDPDAKPPMLKNRRFRLYAISAVLLSIVVIIAVILGTVVFKQGPTPPATYAPTGSPSFAPTNSLQGEYRDQFVAAIGPMVNVPNSPQERAARWILEEDEANLAVDAENLVQRYTMALFYFSTTNNLESRWRSCNPHPTESKCEYLRFTRLADDSIAFTPEESVRWLSSEHECQWAGNLCDDAEITRAIELLGQNITGNIPTELASLPFLQSIALAYNEFTGTMPSIFASMRHLLNMEVHGNNLNGTFPEEYYQAFSLQNLNIGENQFTGTLSTEIGLLTNLKGLQTYENLFTGTFPSEISELEFLSFSRNSDNIFSGTIPAQLGQLSLMQELWMHANQFTGTIPTDLGFMNDMMDMRLHYNKLIGTIPSEFYEFGFLFRLDLFSNHLTGSLQTEIGEFQKMEQLRVSRNELTGTIPTEIANLLKIKLAWFHSNKFVGSMPSGICLFAPEPLQFLQTDCFPEGNAPNPCECCTACCNRDTEICLTIDDNA